MQRQFWSSKMDTSNIIATMREWHNTDKCIPEPNANRQYSAQRFKSGLVEVLSPTCSPRGYCEVSECLPSGLLYRRVESSGNVWRARPPPPNALLVSLSTLIFHARGGWGGSHVYQAWPAMHERLCPCHSYVIHDIQVRTPVTSDTPLTHSNRTGTQTGSCPSCSPLGDRSPKGTHIRLPARTQRRVRTTTNVSRSALPVLQSSRRGLPFPPSQWHAAVVLQNRSDAPMRSSPNALSAPAHQMPLQHKTSAAPCAEAPTLLPNRRGWIRGGGQRRDQTNAASRPRPRSTSPSRAARYMWRRGACRPAARSGSAA